MDGHGNNVVVPGPAGCCLTYMDGVWVPIPVPDNVGAIPRAGGFTFPAHDGHRVAIKAARQMDHYRRVRRNAKSMPEVAALLGGEAVLVDLMYGDIDECCRLFEGVQVDPGVYATYMPN